MKTNTRTNLSTARTHEGLAVRQPSVMTELRRTASACLLFEDTFYESGEDIAKRLHGLVQRAPLLDVLRLAQDLRHVHGLRHAPLWLLNAALDHKDRHQHGDALATVIANVCGSRGDMPGEMLALYWKDGKRPIAKVLRKGLARALQSFGSYAIQKYAARGAIRLRDVLFLTHAKPRDAEQEPWFEMLANDTLPAADTWEVALSGGADKREAFTRLLAEHKLGALAILRNLRNMQDAGVERAAIERALHHTVVGARFGVLPFQFVAAARMVPSFEPAIEMSMLAGVQKLDVRLPGHTLLMVDVSASMSGSLSSRSTLNRADAAAALAILLREVCEDVSVFDYNYSAREVPARRGFALRDAISRPNGGTYTGKATKEALMKLGSRGRTVDRVIVITDEQDSYYGGALPTVNGARCYVMNVAPHKNGIAWGKWTTISGFSENLVKFIADIEQQ